MRTSRLEQMIRELEGTGTLTRNDIEELQMRKLNSLLAREKERQGFYGDLPAKLDCLQDLQKLPFTTEKDLRENGQHMLLCSQNYIQKIITDHTSGTTGAPKRICYTSGDLEHTIGLFMAGLGEFIFPGSVTMIAMPFSGPYGLGELIAEAVEKLQARPVKCGPFLTYGEYREILEKECPDTFVGTPVQLLSILRVCGRGSLRRALVSGDACPDRVIAECERILGSRLFPHYGSREMCLGGAVCCDAHEGMHLRENHVIAEIIGEKGERVPDGAYGELVITTIGMEAQPLIRYRTGDRTRILPGKCPCGCECIRLDKIKRPGPAGMEELDDLLFAVPEMVDYTVYTEENIRYAELLLTEESESALACADKILSEYFGCAPVIRHKKCSSDERIMIKGKRYMRA